MTLRADVQLLEPGDLVEMFEVDSTMIGGTLMYIHGYLQVGSIWWQGTEYRPWPVMAEGWTVTSGQPPIPKISVGNVDSSITQLCALTDDMVGAKVIRHRTLGKYLDAANFGGVNPTANPTEEFPQDIMYVERKAVENQTVIQFELSSPMNFNEVMLPRRLIIANNCGWQYRDSDCGYVGGPVADINDNPTADPAQDNCSLTLNGCRLRNWPNDELPFGGFPAASLVQL